MSLGNINLENSVPFESSTRSKVRRSNLDYDLFCTKTLRNFFLFSFFLSLKKKFSDFPECNPTLGRKKILGGVHFCLFTSNSKWQNEKRIQKNKREYKVAFRGTYENNYNKLKLQLSSLHLSKKILSKSNRVPPISVKFTTKCLHMHETWRNLNFVKWSDHFKTEGVWVR